MPAAPDLQPIAVWVLTPGGLELARRLSGLRPLSVYCSRRLADRAVDCCGRPFERLGPSVAENFHRFEGHIFIMAAGIVVRTIASLLQDKTGDPAVVVVDDRGRFAVSLAAGHLGGANRLAQQVAEQLGGTAVITTATDVNGKPAIDVLARERGLTIENPAAIKAVNMALLTGSGLQVHDPFGLLKGLSAVDAPENAGCPVGWRLPGVYADDRRAMLPDHVLVLRPPTLVAGIGCNRHTTKEEISALLQQVLDDHGLAAGSLCALASIDLKADETGLLALAADLGLPVHFYTRDELNQIRHVPNPSDMAVQHAGVKSVCEAAAILLAHQGNLIVPKHKTHNVTVAIARRSCISSASAPEA